MSPEQIRTAAATLWQAWQDGRKLDALPEACRPSSKQEGYAIQQALAELSQESPFGWKIAATSAAGQKHIGVDGPLAGRLLRGRGRSQSTVIPLDNNVMNVAEAEFAFRMGRDLAPRAQPYSPSEVTDAVAALHPAIEIPDSRYSDFAKVGAAQLIADNGCACYFVLGEPTRADWRRIDLVQHQVQALSNGKVVREGSGANVLGDPRVALTWLANELRDLGRGLKSGEVVITGTCVVPWEVRPGDKVSAEFGVLGRVSTQFAGV
jgi:2-keto-4-pentenoate hydratase